MERMTKKRIAILGALILFISVILPVKSAYAATFYPASTVVAAGNHNIIGTSDVTADQAKAWAKSHGATDTFVSIADLYFKYSSECGQVNPGIAYVQSAKETNFGKFTGVLDESYRNPCGLKTTSGGGNYDPNAHQRFNSWDDGVKAHMDHLALYAGAQGYPKSNTTDPRHFSKIFGKAKTVNDLGGNWAPSATYGNEINSYYNEMVNQNGSKQNNTNIQSNKKTIVIDPGHNYGGDKGAEATIDGVTYKEVELNMQVAEYLKSELEGRGFNVILTRTADQQPVVELTQSLKDRVITANNAGASLFISIHQNSASNEEANGIETYYSSAEQGDDFKGGMVANKIEDSKRIATAISSKVAGSMNIANRGAKDSEFFIKSTNMPSVLVECGFITNRDDAERCSNNEKQKEMAKLIADAVSENL